MKIARCIFGKSAKAYEYLIDDAMAGEHHDRTYSSGITRIDVVVSGKDSPRVVSCIGVVDLERAEAPLEIITQHVMCFVDDHFNPPKMQAPSLDDEFFS